MARTDRTTNAAAANVDALDNIDLDNMFADDGDALFDGLDIDLDHMDDLTDKAVNSVEATAPLSSSRARTERPLAKPQETSAGAPSSPRTDSAPTSNRRTKRKSKYPSFLNDDDDSASLPPNRLKTLSQKMPKTKGTRASNNNTKKDLYSKRPLDDDFIESDLLASQSAKEQTTTASNKLTMTKGKSNQRNISISTSLTAPGQALVTTRGGTLTPPSGVAAAGQFGGRQKRGGTGAITSFVTLPKASAIKGNKLPLISRSSTILEKKGSKPQDSVQPRLSHHDLVFEKADSHPKPKQKLKVEPFEGSTSKSEVSLSSSLSHSDSAPPTKQNRRTSQVQKEFCGLQPSDTDFYPFMSTLPAEPLMKSGEVYPTLGKMHAVFLEPFLKPSTTMGNMNNSETSKFETEPIFQLLEASFKIDMKVLSELSESDSNNKNDKLCKAILSVRRKVTETEKPKIAADLYAVGSLLQKQHDFLQQNSRNMQRWCKNNLPGSDYSTIYTSKDKLKDIYDMSPVREPTVLESFERRDIKVKIVFDAVKESSNKSSTTTLSALLPERFAPSPPSPTAAPSTMTEKSISGFITGNNSAVIKSRKRKLSTTAFTTLSKSISAMPALPKASRISYATIMPAKRRKFLSDQISQTANKLQLAYFAATNDRRTKLNQQDIAMQRFIKDDNAMSQTTTGMWDYLDKAGYFDVLPKSELQYRLNEFKTPFPTLNSRAQPSKAVGTHDERLAESSRFEDSRISVPAFESSSNLFSRMQSLLVEVDESAESDSHDDEDDEDILRQIDFVIDESSASDPVEMDWYDLSKLTVDERAFLHLRSVGFDNTSAGHNGKHFTWPADYSHLLGSSLRIQRKSASLVNCQSHTKQAVSEEFVANGMKSGSGVPKKEGTGDRIYCSHVGELDGIIENMKEDLVQTEQLTNRRLTYLESTMLTPGSVVTAEERKRRNEDDALLISNCRQVLIKSKAEMRAKTERAKANSNDLKLPW